MMMRSDELDKLEDSWIGVSRQIKNGDHIPKKNPMEGQNLCARVTLENEGWRWNQIGPMTSNKEKHLFKYYNIYGEIS
jgi:hypothetical protein